MTPEPETTQLPILLATLRQRRLDGVLVLEQNDGVRRLSWLQGELVYLQSDAAGEQFGSYLLRQGVLDFKGLNELLDTSDRSRLGERVIQSGVLTVEERDALLRRLQEQVMINALEHPVLQAAWNPDPGGSGLSEDLRLELDHRHFIWNTFLEAHNLDPTFDLLHTRSEWTWEGIPGLLEALSDLPLTPATAYALSFLGPEPISFDTFLSLSGLHEEDAARIFLILWAIGALALTQGELPRLDGEPGPEPAPPPPPPPPTPPPAPPEPEPTPARIELDPVPPGYRPESPQPDPAEPDFPVIPAAARGSAEQTPSERARGLYRKARHLHLQEHLGEAIQCLEESVQLDPDSHHAYAAWLLLGNLRMTNPAWSARAVDAYQSATRIKPEAAEPWVGIGLIHYRKGFRTHAGSCFQKALELDPSVPIPEEVDRRSLQDEPLPEPAPPHPRSLLSRFKAVLGGSEKS